MPDDESPQESWEPEAREVFKTPDMVERLLFSSEVPPEERDRITAEAEKANRKIWHDHVRSLTLAKSGIDPTTESEGQVRKKQVYAESLKVSDYAAEGRSSAVIEAQKRSSDAAKVEYWTDVRRALRAYSKDGLTIAQAAERFKVALEDVTGALGTPEPPDVEAVLNAEEENRLVGKFIPPGKRP